MVHNPLLLSKWVNMGEHVENKGAKGARRVNKLLEGLKTLSSTCVYRSRLTDVER